MCYKLLVDINNSTLKQCLMLYKMDMLEYNDFDKYLLEQYQTKKKHQRLITNLKCIVIAGKLKTQHGVI